ncbi:MAG: anaerobic sulfatase maturase [Armatimonadetes bacterium]|nr:anaerobic sulfatase maturase [Armatimonadota bacterium]
MDRVPAYHIMTKPIGPICNLDCRYCYYLEKEQLYPASENFRMSDEVLEEYVRQYIASQAVPEIGFAWQGGEPTLLGVDFFRKVVALQKKYANGKRITNALQTNGVLLDDEWCSFFAEHGFLIGLSIDGPRELHDRYRVDKGQQPTFDRVMTGLSFLKKHKVEFNTLTVINRANSLKPLEVYRFLKEIGSGFLQFIPLVERKPDGDAKGLGLDFSEPPLPGQWSPSEPVTSWSVESRQYGEFLVKIYDEWVRRDVGTVFVQLFDVALGAWMGMESSLCVFAETCGNALVMEHGGDVYSCDHYVYPRYKLGNLMNRTLGDMVNSPEQRKFGTDKLTTLPKYCRECSVRFACNGECPKHRFIRTIDGEPGLNYLCAGYKRFFNHIDPTMREMAGLLQRGLPATRIMESFR